jgi:RNA-binding protein Musashi
MVDRESSRSKGFGFVTFEDATNADQLVGKLGLTIDDKEVLCSILSKSRAHLSRLY